MSGGYRCIVLAAVGWLILTGANHPHAKAEHEQTEAQQAIANHLGNLAASYEAERAEKAQAPKETGPCGQRQYGGNADLCAQWKAADAAADSAWWAWASGIMSFASVIGIVIALGLTVWSNWIARTSARLQLRAYPDFDGVEFSRVAGAAPLGFGRRKLSVRVKNYGQTPASAVALKLVYSLIGAKGTEQVLSKTHDEKSFASIAPTDHIGYEPLIDLPLELLKRIENDAIQFRVWVRVEFTDAFENARTLESAFDSRSGKIFSFVEGTRKIG